MAVKIPNGKTLLSGSGADESERPYHTRKGGIEHLLCSTSPSRVEGPRLNLSVATPDAERSDSNGQGPLPNPQGSDKSHSKI